MPTSLNDFRDLILDKCIFNRKFYYGNLISTIVKQDTFPYNHVPVFNFFPSIRL